MHLVGAGAADGDQADGLLAVGDYGGPVATSQTANDQEAGFAAGSCWNFQQSRIPPEGLGGQKINAVLKQVGVAFAGIELKVYSELNLYRFGASQCFQEA